MTAHAWWPRIRGLVLTLFVLLAISVITFGLLQLSGSSPGAYRLGSSASAADILAYNESVGFTKPLVTRYVDWLTAFVSGDFGESWLDRKSVGAQLLFKAPITLYLTLGGLAIGLVLGVGLGLYQGLRAHGPLDRILQSGTATVLAIPPIWLGLVLAAVVSVELKLLPVGGYVAPSTDMARFLRSMILPWIAAGIPFAAIVARQTRASSMSVLQSDFVRSARALGMSPTRVLLRHALRPSITPVSTLLGIQVAVTIGNAVLVETVFSLPGLGGWLVTAAQGGDQPVLMATVMLCAIAVMLGRAAADSARLWLDPRSRP